MTKHVHSEEVNNAYFTEIDLINAVNKFVKENPTKRLLGISWSGTAHLAKTFIHGFKVDYETRETYHG